MILKWIPTLSPLRLNLTSMIEWYLYYLETLFGSLSDHIPPHPTPQRNHYCDYSSSLLHNFTMYAYLTKLYNIWIYIILSSLWLALFFLRFFEYFWVLFFEFFYNLLTLPTWHFCGPFRPKRAAVGHSCSWVWYRPGIFLRFVNSGINHFLKIVVNVIGDCFKTCAIEECRIMAWTVGLRTPHGGRLKRKPQTFECSKSDTRIFKSPS